MAVRRKLDLAGVKLKLVHWHGHGDAAQIPAELAFKVEAVVVPSHRVIHLDSCHKLLKLPQT
jgi:hypothetical protein